MKEFFQQGLQDLRNQITNQVSGLFAEVLSAAATLATTLALGEEPTHQEKMCIRDRLLGLWVSRRNMGFFKNIPQKN
ncbi:hypothetical protein, partial [Bacillus amyloliquefaciens]|uniref:hypothetical protein n=1 Tax=Bacillus amyloliquefaciens TaxID=1390 RepID=UPI00197AC901